MPCDTHLGAELKSVQPCYDADYAGRLQKATKILAVLRDFLGMDLSNYIVLDVGCSIGAISYQLAQRCQTIFGIDMNRNALGEAIVHSIGQNNLYFTLADGLRMPFPDNTFDIIICAQVYEHVSNPPSLAAEIWRVLRPGGICFFSGPNRLAIIEEHYWLPFLSWLPQRVANGYMRAFRRGEVYDVSPRFYWELRQLWKFFVIHEYTIPLIRDPARFAVQDKLKGYSWFSRLPVWLLRWLTLVLPNYNWILEKRYESIPS